jgi:hypothetical protein
VSDPHIAVSPSATHTTAAALDESSTIAIAHISSIEIERIAVVFQSINRPSERSESGEQQQRQQQQQHQ